MGIKKKYDVWSIFSAAIILFYIVFMIYPLFSLLTSSFIDPETKAFSLFYFKKFFSKPYYLKAVKNSFVVSSLVTICAVCVATPLAYILSTVKIKGSGWIRIVIMVTSMSAPFIGSYSWIMLLGRNGFIHNIVKNATGIELPAIYGLKGIVLVLTLALVPLVFSYITGAMKNMDKSLLEAAKSLGSDSAGIIFKIVIPIIVPTILAAGVLVFMRALADFGTPMLIGEGYKTVPQLIYNEFLGDVSRDKGFAAAISLLVITVAIGAFLIQKFISKKLSYTVSAMYPVEPQPAEGIKNILCHAYIYLYLLIALLPQITIWVSAFRKTKGLTFDKGFSLGSFQKAIDSMDVAILNTFKFSVGAVLLIVLISVIVAYSTVRRPNPLTNTLDVITMAPYIVPGSILGIAYASAFSHRPLLLTGTALIIIVVLTIKRMPYTVRSSSAILMGIGKDLEEASLNLGANSLKTFGVITLPLMAPGVLSGAIMSCLSIITELSSSIMLYTGKTITMTIAIYAQIVRGSYGVASALSVMLSIFTIVLILLIFKITGRKELSM